MNLSLKEKIVVHINYRDIFNAPVLESDLCLWVNARSRELFDNAINELVEEGLICRAGLYITLPNKIDLADTQPAKDKLADALVAKGNKGIKRLAKIPFVRLVGVSGSVAAHNPVADAVGDNEGEIDLDIFLIVNRNSLWIFHFVYRLIHNITHIFNKNYFYCLNFIMEDSMLEIPNKNLFTATELNNLVVMHDKNCLNKLMNENKWFYTYYNEKSNDATRSGFSKFKQGILSLLLVVPNFSLFLGFHTMRVLKHFNFKPLKEFTLKYDPKERYNYRRIAPYYGGYQSRVIERFNLLLRQNFPDYYREDLIKKVFPDNSTFAKDQSVIEELQHDGEMLFTKYA